MGIKVSQYFRNVEAGWSPWRYFNPENNMQDFYCENTFFGSDVVTRGRDVWPLHFDSGLLANKKVLQDWITMD